MFLCTGQFLSVVCWGTSTPPICNLHQEGDFRGAHRHWDLSWEIGNPLFPQSYPCVFSFGTWVHCVEKAYFSETYQNHSLLWDFQRPFCVLKLPNVVCMNVNFKLSIKIEPCIYFECLKYYFESAGLLSEECHDENCTGFSLVVLTCKSVYNRQLRLRL